MECLDRNVYGEVTQKATATPPRPDITLHHNFAEMSTVSDDGFFLTFCLSFIQKHPDAPFTHKMQNVCFVVQTSILRYTFPNIFQSRSMHLLRF